MHTNYLVFADTTKLHRGAHNHRVKEQKEDHWNKTKGQGQGHHTIKTIYYVHLFLGYVCNHGSAKCVHTKEPDKCPVIIQSKSVSGMGLCCTTPTP
jgi:hypothetical protein